MASKGRKSAASLAVVPTSSVGRIRPPAGLPESVKDVFADIVASMPADHFIRADAPLLVEYSTMIITARQAAEAMNQEGLVVGGRPSPWLTVQEKAQRMITALSLRLRLCPQGRVSAAKAGNRIQPGTGGRGITFEGLTDD